MAVGAREAIGGNMRAFRTLPFLALFGCGFATADTFLIKSNDAGRTWVDIDPGPPDTNLALFGIGQATPGLYALTHAEPQSGGRLSISPDGGRTWQTRQTFPGYSFGPLGLLVAAVPAVDVFYMA